MIASINHVADDIVVGQAKIQMPYQPWCSFQSARTICASWSIMS